VLDLLAYLQIERNRGRTQAVGFGRLAGVPQPKEITMIGYVTLGTNDLPRAAAFYDELLAIIGAKRLMDFERGYAWGRSMSEPGLGITKPFDGKPASVGNGVMAAIVVDSRAKVDALHAKALALGGKDEGAPGERSPGFYAGYFRDLDGNKLNAFTMG
jgi:catechol 2,3-dioxygenase-like lactoylglutathione lyase family enzyme